MVILDMHTYFNLIESYFAPHVITIVLFTSLCITARVINPRTAVISVKIRNAALFVYQVRAWTSLKGRQPMRARGGMGAWLQASFDWLLLKRGEHTCYM